MLNSRYFGSFVRARSVRALAAALTVCACSFALAQAAGGHWTVSAVEGAAVMIVAGGEEYAAQRGYPVTAGTTMVTGDDGTVVLIRRGDSITVFPNSEMTIPVVSGEGEPGVLQSIGKLLFRMETRESRDFEVRTPFLAATIKGTVFTVDVGRTRATVAVTEGLVRVVAARGGRSEAVRPGWSATAEFGNDLVELGKNSRSRTNDIVETANSSPGRSSHRDKASGDAESGDAESGDAASGDAESGKSSRGRSSPGKGKEQGNQNGQK